MNARYELLTTLTLPDGRVFLCDPAEFSNSEPPRTAVILIGTDKASVYAVLAGTEREPIVRALVIVGSGEPPDELLLPQLKRSESFREARTIQSGTVGFYVQHKDSFTGYLRRAPNGLFVLKPFEDGAVALLFDRAYAWWLGVEKRQF